MFLKFLTNSLSCFDNRHASSRPRCHLLRDLQNLSLALSRFLYNLSLSAQLWLHDRYLQEDKNVQIACFFLPRWEILNPFFVSLFPPYYKPTNIIFSDQELAPLTYGQPAEFSRSKPQLQLIPFFTCLIASLHIRLNSRKRPIQLATILSGSQIPDSLQ